jgi:signal transduction histidine kinase
MWTLEREFLEAEPHVSDIIEATREFFLDTDDWQDRQRRLVLHITEGFARNGRLDRLDEGVLDYACVPLPDGGCFVSDVDVTDTVGVQRTLEERNIALEMADQVKSEFIANVSYELRTPLNTIARFTDVLDSELLGTLHPRQREYVSGIVTASRQLTELADVYETFEHGDPCVRRAGSGLGLVLTRSLLELHRGSLEIRNDAERGTHVVAYFPIAGPAPIATKARVAE